MFKYVYVLTLCFCLCAANDLSETGRKKGDYLLYGSGLLYYLTFLVIKIKIIAVVGTLITLALIAGKAYAFYKYIAYIESHHHHDEPIYAESPPLTPYFNKEVYLDHSPYELGHDHDHDHDHHVYEDAPPSESHDKTYNVKYPNNKYNYNYQARRIDDVSNVLDMTTRIFRRLKLSELAFDAMHIKSEDCKKKFMCEAYVHAENNRILSLGLMILNDTSQEKYKPAEEVSSVEECQRTYDQCAEVAKI